MKFKIESLETMMVKTKYGPKTKFRFVSDGQTFDAWSKKGYTDNFKVGHNFDAELSGKPFKGVDTVQWPTTSQQPFTPSQPQLDEAVKIQLDRMERKIDKLLSASSGSSLTYSSPEGTCRTSEVKAHIPYADSPTPTDEDIPY